MSASVDSFKINLNQNLWGLIVGLFGLGIADHFNLCTLFWFSFLVSVVMVVSVGVTTYAYTINYWREKMNRGKNP